MSEALADLARLTGDGAWLLLAARFERPCFVQPLLLAGHLEGEEAAAAAAQAIELTQTPARSLWPAPEPDLRTLFRLGGLPACSVLLPVQSIAKSAHAFVRCENQ